MARIAGDLTVRARALTVDINRLEREITALITPLAPTLLAVCGVGALTAAKIVGEVADVHRFRSKDAFARHTGTAPQPAWSGQSDRHRLSRGGNRQLNAALHRVTITQGRYHPDAVAYLARRRTGGDTKAEARRALKRRLSDVIYRCLVADTALVDQTLATAA